MNTPQREPSFLDRLNEVANIIVQARKEGRKSLFNDEPLPLIGSNKFSMHPDIKHGWKPDNESMISIPALAQFKMDQERFSSV